MFNQAKEIDTQKEYGKNVFAQKVVRDKASSIDFTGFRPLLTNIEAVIKTHAAAIADAASNRNVLTSEIIPSAPSAG